MCSRRHSTIRRTRWWLAAEEAVLARVLRPSADATGWAFVHDLYRSVLDAELQPARRAVLHGAIGEALERRGSQGAERVPAGRLAAHFLASGRSGRDKASGLRPAGGGRGDATVRPPRDGPLPGARAPARRRRRSDPRRELLLELGAARHRAGDRDGAADLLPPGRRSPPTTRRCSPGPPWGSPPWRSDPAHRSTTTWRCCVAAMAAVRAAR